jgi:phosphohistidine phosphatase
VTESGGNGVRRLLVLRHGQAEDGPPDGADIDRALSDRGRRAVAALAPVLERLDPDLVLCSSALRTRQTTEALGLDPGVEVSLEPGLYGAEADTLLEHVREVDEDVATVLVVAHNPGVHHLVLEVSGGERVAAFRPATLAVLELDVGTWWEAGPGAGRLVSLHVPDRDAE